MLKELCGFEVPEDDVRLARFRAWRQALYERPSIARTMLYDKDPELMLLVRPQALGPDND